MHKKAVDHILQAELDAYLDNVNYERTTTENYRNGHNKKTVKSSFGEAEIVVPGDRQGNFDAVLVPKGHNIIDGLEKIIITCYAKGMGVDDIRG
ncbi:MAG TPA: transposase, partial [Candidatus Sphingobacterium stercoripullorum]|nr:transposase [Candidatus Sphingobacterium stercoripullorum]